MVHDSLEWLRSQPILSSLQLNTGDEETSNNNQQNIEEKNKKKTIKAREVEYEHCLHEMDELSCSPLISFYSLHIEFFRLLI